MSFVRGLRVATLGALCVSCAHPPPATVRTWALGEREGYPVAALHLASMTGVHPPFVRADLELRRDGSLVWQGSPAGRLAGARVLDGDGHEVASVGRDGTVTLPTGLHHAPARHRVRVVDGAVVVDDDDRFYFDEQGRVVETRGGQHPHWIFLQLAGFTQATLPTGALMVLVTLVRTHRI